MRFLCCGLRAIYVLVNLLIGTSSSSFRMLHLISDVLVATVIMSSVEVPSGGN